MHELLERLDFERPAVASEAEVGELVESHGAIATPEEVADLRDMVERFAGSELFARIARAERVRTELPFAFTLSPPGAGGRSLLVNGVVDVHAVESDRLLVVDYKSDALDGRDPVELTAEAYSTQRLVYALAGLRSGAERVEVAHCFLEQPERLAVGGVRGRGGRPARGGAARPRRRGRGRALRAERRAAPGAVRRLPGRAALCSWDEQHTLSSS